MDENVMMDPVTQPHLTTDAAWRPAYLPVSAWHEHGLFARWIVGALRPRTIVELGTHNGFSYFVFCDAVIEHGVDATLHAVDTWQGDDHAGFYNDEVFAEVNRINTAKYGEFSTLHRGYFDDAVSDFEDGSIDLLHIDGRHGYDDVKHDFESWLPKMSARGVVLFHDIAERQPGFGVWRFWEELAAAHPSFAFEHGHGLGVLAVGTEVPESLRGLFELPEEKAEAVRGVYEAWGAIVTEEYEIETARRELAAARSTLAEQAARLAALEADTTNLRNEVASLKQYNTDLQQTLSWRITKPLRAVRAARRH